MNKEVIKKYKEAFDHWLEGGSVCYLNTDLDTWYTLGERQASQHPTWEGIGVYIVNDKYVEFRKAWAEGKMVQYQTSMTCGDDWLDMCADGGKPFMRSDFTNMRIKPDEPVFKIGDWVRTPKGVRTISIDYGKFAEAGLANKFCTTSPLDNSGLIFPTEKLSLWKPKPGEWCWFFDKDSRTAIIAQYKGIKETEVYTYYVSTFQIDEGLFLNCEPFIGPLPTHLQGK